MMTPLYEVRAAFLPAGSRVRSVDGVEALNEPYRFCVSLDVPPAESLELDLDAAIGKRATLRIIDRRTGVARFVYHGIVATFELVEDCPQYSAFRLELVPALWQLGLGQHSRVFVRKSLQDIVAQTLIDGGLTSADFDLRLGDASGILEFVCQYRESRLAFLTRWLARVGACYFFEQGDDREKLIVAVGEGARRARQGPVRFEPVVHGKGAPESLWSLRWQNAVLPRKVSVKDYNPSKPLLAVVGTADVAAPTPGGDVHAFGVNENLPDKAKAYAQTRALQYSASRTTYRGHGSVLGLAPGLVFQLEGHARAALNRRYFVTAVRHTGSSGGLGDGNLADIYGCEVDAVDAGTPWVPPVTQPWPRVVGTVRARVDGPQDSQYAQLDEEGRYLVRLMLDESGSPDGSASSRVRMLQPHAGDPEGLHLPLRKGTEVQIGFLKGDPDQPVIAGAVPNAVTPSPVTEANHTQNVLQTGGRNRLEIDDREGAEYLDLSSPPESSFLHLGAHAGLGTHNYVWSTQGDFSAYTGGNLAVNVGGRRTETVTGDVAETYYATRQTHVDGHLTETIDGGLSQTVGAGLTQSIDGGLTQTISGRSTRSIVGGQTQSISGGWTQTVTGARTESITGPLTQTTTGDVSITSPGGYTVVAAGGQTFRTPCSVQVLAKGGFNIVAPAGQRRLDFDWKQLGDELVTAVPMQVIMAGHRIDVRVLQFELFAFQIILAGMKYQVHATLRQGAIACVDNYGHGFDQHLLHQNTGSFHLW
jgi:type VI secretion system secreted protein VgrG